MAQQLHGPVQNRLLVASHRLRMAMESGDVAAENSVKHIQQASDLIADVNQATSPDPHTPQPLISTGLPGKRVSCQLRS